MFFVQYNVTTFMFLSTKQARVEVGDKLSTSSTSGKCWEPWKKIWKPVEFRWFRSSSMAEDDVTFPFNGCDSWEWINELNTWEFLVVEGVEMHMELYITLLVKLWGVATWDSQVFRWRLDVCLAEGPAPQFRAWSATKQGTVGVPLISSGFGISEPLRIHTDLVLIVETSRDQDLIHWIRLPLEKG